MLADLKSQTEKGEPDYENICQAHEKIKALNYEINLKKRESDSLEKIQSINSKLYFSHWFLTTFICINFFLIFISYFFIDRIGKKPKLQTTGRYFLWEGNLQLVAKIVSSTSSQKKKQVRKETPSERFLKKSEQMFWILFNDTLIWSETKEKRKNLVNSILRYEALKEMATFLISAIDLEEKHFEHLSVLDELNSGCMFVLQTPECDYLLKCETVKEKTKWMASFKEASESQKVINK